ncbi:MAG: tRNA (guanine-N(1)-)-methyltransferase [Candidatus Giovannonibacteria bacterium GW2011_GWC2_44_9]|uniref:tRNA (guanine-N(1)-)-methyltransferase n=1 Tax=Candidatus Giovannonibacteria bacterium GW2011_GWC2_44_9 TaxID=1618658 RepID=A0A0G1NHK5_9BACT|nr:MAG: tRNA (guanine-N(1)-)-methyltransferase [Candidatus Giovannonibacteria bacterium GW2011_GWC2_44_9]
MRFDIITIFPKIFDSYFSESIIKRAVETKKIRIKVWNLRDFTKDKHKKIDNKPYGGGPGMVIGVEAFARVLNKIKKPKSKLILLSARGKQLTSKIAGEWATKYKNIILIAGRYEGVDERVKDIFKAEEISIGPYVLTGGEIPVMAVVDAVSRHIPEVLGKSESLEEKRYGVGVPVYTRPEVFIYKNKKYKVPEVLLSGDHTKIENWRIKHKK